MRRVCPAEPVGGDTVVHAQGVQADLKRGQDQVPVDARLVVALRLLEKNSSETN